MTSLSQLPMEPGLPAEIIVRRGGEILCKGRARVELAVQTGS